MCRVASFLHGSLGLPKISSTPRLREQMKQLPALPPSLLPYSGSLCAVPLRDLLWDVAFQNV